MVTEVTREHVGDIIARLEQRTSFRHRPGVSLYLHEQPDLVPILLEAIDEHAVRFGPDTPIVLEVLTDPDEEDEVKTLTAIIQTTLEPKQVIDLQHRFNDAWWREASFRTGDPLSFGVEYV